MLLHLFIKRIKRQKIRKTRVQIRITHKKADYVKYTKQGRIIYIRCQLKKGKSSGEFKKKLRLSRGNYVSNPSGDVFSTGIKGLIT